MTAAVAIDERPHVVYELWRGDVCLYVGMTSNLPARLSAHRARNAMVQSSTRIEVMSCLTQAAAADLEQQKIRELRPANNIRLAAS